MPDSRLRDVKYSRDPKRNRSSSKKYYMYWKFPFDDDLYHCILVSPLGQQSIEFLWLRIKSKQQETKQSKNENAIVYSIEMYLAFC